MKEIWMPHAAHFICGDRCSFKLATYSNGYIVSTVGEYRASYISPDYETIGSGRLYETMVFKAKKSKENLCCPYVIESGMSIDFAGYNTPEDATKGHHALLKKWQRKKRGRCEGTTANDKGAC
jgi:hypothetical protein